MRYLKLTRNLFEIWLHQSIFKFLGKKYWLKLFSQKLKILKLLGHKLKIMSLHLRIKRHTSIPNSESNNLLLIRKGTQRKYQKKVLVTRYNPAVKQLKRAIIKHKALEFTSIEHNTSNTFKTETIIAYQRYKKHSRNTDTTLQNMNSCSNFNKIYRSIKKIGY